MSHSAPSQHPRFFHLFLHVYIHASEVPAQTQADQQAEDTEDHQFTQIVVGVVYETTAVYYDADGNVLPADWNLKLDTGTITPGNGGQEGGN